VIEPRPSVGGAVGRTPQQIGRGPLHARRAGKERRQIRIACAALAERQVEPEQTFANAYAAETTRLPAAPRVRVGRPQREQPPALLGHAAAAPARFPRAPSRARSAAAPAGVRSRG
jgi:hypothetical protein